MCRVFMDSGQSNEASLSGFRLPTLQRLTEWQPKEVARWLSSLVPFNPADSSLSHAKGVTPDIKKWLQAGLKVNPSILQSKLSWGECNRPEQILQSRLTLGGCDNPLAATTLNTCHSSVGSDRQQAEYSHREMAACQHLR